MKTRSEGEQSERDRMKQAMDALRNLPPERMISAMPVIVSYTATIGAVEHYKRGEEHVFIVRRMAGDRDSGYRWDSRPLNAHGVRDEFLSVMDWSGAYDFLTNTGTFSPLDDTITWPQFQRWQEFARLIAEHSRLARAMQEGDWKGECAEVLKALTGNYPNSLFRPEPYSPHEVESLERQKQHHPEIIPMLQESERHQEELRRSLLLWFRRPPGEACSIEWFPKRQEDADAIIPKLGRGGAMIEFLLPREALRPAFLIRPFCTLQAIAAAIYADYSNGVDYRTCEFCHKLFPVGAQKTKRFCNQSKCKNAAHSREVRKKRREQEAQLQRKVRRSAAGKRGRASLEGKKGK